MNLTNFHTKLPEVLCEHIKGYLRIQEKYLTNKTDYIKYKTKIHTSLFRIVPPFKLSKVYLTKLIRNDYNFIFEIIINIKFESWYKPWKIRYKGNIAPCFIELLNLLCIENKSQRCRNVIQLKLNEKGIRKNKHKRIRVFNNKWSN